MPVGKLTGHYSNEGSMIKERIDKMKYFNTRAFTGWLYRYERDYCKQYAQIHWDLSESSEQVIAGIWTREKAAAEHLAKTIYERLLYYCPCCDDDPEIIPSYSFDIRDCEEIANVFIEEFADRTDTGYSEETLKYIAMENTRKALEMRNQNLSSRKRNWFVRLINHFA
jgi:hypothetical protein